MLDRAAVDGSLRFRQVRDYSERLCEGLTSEDCNLQAVAETSPLKWHLAHTTWFFETFVLRPFKPDYRGFDDRFQVLFNSYYNGVGQQHPRPQRHLLSRPDLAEVLAYRHHVDQGMVSLLDQPAALKQPEIMARLTLGLNHEQQHQELMLTDLKYNFACNPLAPAYRSGSLPPARPAEGGFQSYQGGLVEIGQARGEGFGFDNERPRHRHWLEPFTLARALVTNGEFRAFIEDGGYRRPELWLSDGWSRVQQEDWRHPLYWQPDDTHPGQFTLYGNQPPDDHHPVCHLSYFEADAYARWLDARLPSEAEWEHACRQDQGDAAAARTPPALHPTGADTGAGLRDLFGQVWQWTASAYAAYPAYRTARGALGEYNGKFMCSQFVLRGSSCATPPGHSRASYRNFFYPESRWQFTGLRLARDATSADL
ncbi:MAG: ergothioneine biosynthesis protein EgtB [Marinobacter sp.]|uniref:ergothioneine biosynthesis protein EgtB n=1 Tax=Marinobacter sp. TaxID=50741 RepID=UPI00299D5F92|nr:ergothioneine biosynthesis protein EgtB [Marinobacter sp.]MDX1635861.1 ergothioneine biosynthesis protein EgtB [Marinobacter sp.]